MHPRPLSLVSLALLPWLSPASVQATPDKERVTTIVVTSWEFDPGKEKEYTPYPVDIIVSRNGKRLVNLATKEGRSEITRTVKGKDKMFSASITIPKGGPVRLVVCAGRSIVPKVIGLSAPAGGEQKLDLALMRIKTHEDYSKRNPGTPTSAASFERAREAIGDEKGDPLIRGIKDTLDVKKVFNKQELNLQALRTQVRAANLSVGKKRIVVQDRLLIELSKLGEPKNIRKEKYLVRRGTGNVGPFRFATGVETGYLGARPGWGIFASTVASSGVAVAAPKRVVVFIPWGEEPGRPELIPGNPSEMPGFFGYVGSGPGYFLVVLP